MILLELRKYEATLGKTYEVTLGKTTAEGVLGSVITAPVVCGFGLLRAASLLS